MLRYQKKRRCKALSIILAAVMILTTPIGVTQAYALEAGKPAAAGIQSELPLGASGVLGSRTPSMASAVPAFAEGYPKPGTVQPDGSKEIAALVKGILPEGETSMGLGYVLLADHDPAPTAEQIAFSRGYIPGATVITWGQQILGDSETTITLTGAQDGTDYDFYAVCLQDDIFSEIKHLDMKTPAAGSGTPGTPILAPPTGLKWNTAGIITAKWDPVVNAASYDVTLWKEGYFTMLVQYTGFKGTELSVQANIAGSTGNYFFTVQAIAEGYTSSLKPASSVYPYIAPLYGNVMISNMSPKIGDTLTGSLMYGNNTGTLHYAWKAGGTQVGADAASYTVTADALGKAITLEITSTVETGTRNSTATAEVSADPAVLKVTTPDDLKAALGSVPDGGTITLSKSIDYDKGIVINEKSFRLDLGSYTLNVVNSTGIGIDIKNAILTVSGDGKLNATGTKGVQAHNSKISVYSATGTAGAGVEASCSSYAGGAPCEVTVETLIQGTIAGAYAMNDDCKIIAGSAKAIAINGRAVYAKVGGEVEISGNVDALNGHGVYCVNGSATIGGNVTSKNTAVFLYEKGSIVINGNVNTDNGSGTAVEIDGNGIPSNGTVTIGGTVSASDAFYVRFVNGVRTKNEGVPDGAYLKYTDSIDGEKAGIIRVKKAPAVWMIGAQEFTSLADAVAAAPDGETTTITLLQSITHYKPVEINGKSIIFALGGFDFTIDTSAISNATALRVLGDGKVSCIGSGKLNVVGSDYGVRASGGSELHISGNVTARQYAVTAGSAPGIGTPRVTVDGDVTVTGQDVNAGSEVEAVSVGGYATVTIGGNVTANRTDAMQFVTAVYSNASTITVGKNVTTQGSGVNAQNGGKVTIGGALHYNPTGSDDQAYIKLGYPVVAKTADDFEPTSIKPEYKEYKNGDNVVWVKAATSSSSVCAIGGTEYTTLTDALAKVKTAETIKLLKDINYDKGIIIDGKTVTFDVGSFTLSVTNTTSSHGIGLTVTNNGHVNLVGSGEFNVTHISNFGESIGLLVHGGSSATVTNVKAVAGVGSGVYADGDGAIIHVLGNVEATGSSAYGAKTWNAGLITIDGMLMTASRYIDIGGKYKAKTEGVEDPTKTGYLKYSDSKSGGVVWVKDTPPPATYPLTVQSGIGGGSFTKDSIVTIIANSAPAGQRFKEWEVSPVVIFTDASSKTDAIAKFIMPAQAVTATAAYEALPDSHYAITIQNDGNGTASANVNSAAKGEEITLTASANGGYVFKEWQVISGGVSIVNSKFIMPEANVTIKAIFEPIPTIPYNVTVNGSHALITGAGSYVQNAAVTINAGNRSGYSFIGWTSSDGVIFANSNSAITTFSMPAKNVTVTANWSYNGGSDSTGYSGSAVITTPEKRPDQPAAAAIAITATAGANGTACAAIPDQYITDAIAKAQSSAKAQGKTAFSVELDVTMPQGANSLTVTLSQNAVSSLVSAGASSLDLNESLVSVSLDQKAMEAIHSQSSGNIIISITPVKTLPDSAKILVGSRPVYEITISYVKDGKTIVISSFNGGIVTLGIPYKPGKNEAVGYLYGVYVDENGKATRITGSAYDANARVVLIPATHLSVYGIGYTAPSVKFTDVEKHWAQESIDYVVGRGLFSGVSDTAFSPDTAMSRGMLVTVLGRLAGADVSGYTQSSFTDVSVGSVFRPYIEWAYENGVVQGVGNQRFAPDRAITREEIAAIFARYANATGYKLPVIREATAYADASGIGSVYKTAVTAMQHAGIMMGGTDNQFNPKAGATRAEVGSMLHRYIKLTIDPSAAQGWALNDAGQWLCYKDGKALTGTQTIDGVKYFFSSDGALKTGWVKDGDNWRYYAGNKAAVGWLSISDKRYYLTNDGLMVSGKWLQIDSRWYYFYANGSLAKDTEVDGYEVGPDGARSTK